MRDLRRRAQRFGSGIPPVKLLPVDRRWSAALFAMSPGGRLYALLLCLCPTLQAQSETPVFVRVTEGQGATLPCEIKQRVSREELSVIWETPEERVFTLIKGTPRYGAGFENRVNFESANRVADGDLSLNISGIRVADRGVYSCYWTRDSHTLRFACSVVVAVAERGHLDRDPTSNLGSGAESSTPSNPTTPPAETGVANRENRLIILAAAATAVVTLMLAIVFVVRKKMITKLKELKQQRGLTAVTVVSDEDFSAIKKNLLSNGHGPSSGPAELSSGHLTATKDPLL
ncbi:CD276 antigen-like isoform X1 [Lepisosteus oculatus]|uniref:CD276 antigen-like isoform X1 n=2 Tax=Lepisosteus oculatus TaxID=7918 RepID=UPI0035F5280B